MFFGFAVLLPILMTIYGGFHTVQEGHVGIYFRGGALLKEISEPGYHTKLPILTKVEEVQVTV